MTTIAVGTEKGAWFLRRDDQAEDGWAVDGPHLAGWKVTAFGRAPDGRTLAAIGSNWFGAAIHASDDLAAWTQVGAPSWTEAQAEGGRSLDGVWTLTTVGDTVWAGVADAGLFTSTDLDTWTPVDSFNEQDGRDDWMPGLGGLCAHHVLADGDSDDRLWVAVSSVGVFRSTDGGDTWERRDDGVPPTGTPEDGMPSAAWCVHGLTVNPDDPSQLWRQEHIGLFRSVDGGTSWERIGDEIASESGFGFPMVRDHSTGRLFVVPQHSDARRLPVDGAFAAWSSDDDGDTWRVAGTGWPEAPTWTGVLRGAMATDSAGVVAAGTTSGDVWLSEDGGDSWRTLPATFPRIGAVSVLP